MSTAPVVRWARLAVALVVVLLASVLSTMPAAAYWTATGSGQASAQTGTLAAPTNVTVPASAISDVPVSWTAATGLLTPDGYFVTRDAGVAACASGLTNLLSGTSCTDAGVPDGPHTYVVTAVYRSWTAPSAASSPVVVTNPSQLAFVGEPSDTLVGTAVSPAVTITLLSTGGSTVALAGVPVTLAINVPTGSAPGTLSGTLTVSTDAQGVATFGDLSYDQPGTGYTLTASSPGLTAATSSAFAVLGPAAHFSVLGGNGVVSTGFTTVSGDLGADQGSAVTGFPDGVVAGDIHIGDATEQAARADLDQSYASLATPHSTTDLPSEVGGVRTLTPGTYHSVAAVSVTTELTLDGGGDPNAVFVIQVDAALNTAASTTVKLTGGAKAANVYWVVLGAVNTGADSTFAGQILAVGAITLGARSVLIGRALSDGTVTLAANTIRFTTELPPSITLDGGAAAVTKDTTPTITGTTSAAVGRVVTVTVGTQTLTTTVRSTGTWSVTAAALLAHDYQVVAKVRDAAGNAAAASQTLTVEVSPAPVELGSAESFSVLAATSVVSTGATAVSGDLGISPGGSLSGFPPGEVAGQVHLGDSVSGASEADLLTAIGDAKGRAPHSELPGDLGGRTFHAGVRHSSAALGLTGTVTLDAENDPDAVFIFQVDAAFTTAASSRMLLVNGAQPAHVYWVVTGAVTTAASTAFAGTIMAQGAITLGAGTELLGRALSRTTVTLAGNSVRFTSALPPSIAIDGGATGTTKDTTPTISGSTTALAGRTVAVTVNGQTSSTTVQADGTWSTTAAELIAGSYPVLARVKDAAGNGALDRQTLIVETNPDPVDLGSAAGFSVLAGTAVTSSGGTQLDDDVGVSPGLLVLGLLPSDYDRLHLNDSTAKGAQADLRTAIDDASGRTAHTQVVGNLAGQTFHEGVHHSTGAFALTGTVTLDAEGDPDAVFIFQGDAALTTAAGSTVALVNGAQASHVFWVLDNGAVSTGANTSFAGTVLADGAVTLGAGTDLVGRVLSTGNVTLANNTISEPS